MYESTDTCIRSEGMLHVHNFVASFILNSVLKATSDTNCKELIAHYL